MTDAQIISIAITLFAIAAGSLFNNVRISDSNTSLNKRFDDLTTSTNKRFEDLTKLIQSEDSRTRDQLTRMEQTLISMLNDHEQRIRSLEQQRPH